MDGSGNIDEGYDYARNIAGLDFASFTDHGPTGPAWRNNVQAMERHNHTNDFVTLLGFEWSDSRHGHRNVYYRGEDGPELPPLSDNMVSLWNWLDRQPFRAMTIPHHPNTDSEVKGPDGKAVWGPMDWSVVNDKYQRVVEIFQKRGSFEAPGGPNSDLLIDRRDVGSSVQTALAKGHRLGFIASTDTHYGRPGADRGLAAVIGETLSGDAIWDGIFNRSCYATSGPRILLFFTVNGNEMGREINANVGSSARHVKWRAIGTGPIKTVDLLRNNIVVKTWKGNHYEDLADELTWSDQLNEVEWWYVRVTQEDRAMAWSSPIWFVAHK